MAEREAQREPTMAEILSSIRRMLSEDDAREDGAAPASSTVPAGATALPAPAPVGDVLDLTEVVQDDGTVVTLPSRAAARGPAAREEASPADPTTDAFVLLAAAVRNRETRLGEGGRTIEDIVRELLRPLLRDWLDRNLRPIVARAVEREVARVARRPGDD